VGKSPETACRFAPAGHAFSSNGLSCEIPELIDDHALLFHHHLHLALPRHHRILTLHGKVRHLYFDYSHKTPHSLQPIPRDLNRRHHVRLPWMADPFLSFACPSSKLKHATYSPLHLNTGEPTRPLGSYSHLLRRACVFGLST